MVVALFAGCANIVMQPQQSLRVDTAMPDGRIVDGASCTLRNEHGSVAIASGSSSLLQRSSADAAVECLHPDHVPGSGRLISRANVGMAGNLLFGGAIGAVIDHGKGSGYSYPTWIQVVFGQSRVYDRDHQQGSRPLAGRIDPSPPN